MRCLFAVLAVLLLFLPPHAQAARPLAKPKLIAAYVYADWCPNCKALSPIYEEARGKGAFDTQPILFVKLDLTDKPRIQQSILLASALGIAGWFQPQGSATGYVAVLDAQSKKELARFDRTATSAGITAKITELLGSK